MLFRSKRSSLSNAETPSLEKTNNYQCEIVLPNNHVQKLDFDLDFSFEKNRIKIMENTELFASINSSNIGCDVQAEVIKHAEENFIEIHNRYKTIDYIVYWVRNLAIVFTLVFTIGMLGTFFGILLITTNDSLIQSYIIFLVSEAIASLMFIYLSMKMTSINRSRIEDSQRTFKFGLILLIILISIIIGTFQYINVRSLILCASAKDTEIEIPDRVVCVIMLYSFFSTIVKILVIIGYSSIWILIQLLLKRINQMKVLVKEKS